MRILAITNQKGGCGKTTVAINLSACLAREGRRVLLVDMDPQSHCALGLAVPEDQIELSIAQVLESEGGATELSRITWQIAANFDLAPSRTDLAAYEYKMSGVAGADLRLRKVLLSVADKYDFAVIDCPPHIGLLTMSALRAAGEVIVPVDTGYFSLQGLTKQLETIDRIREHTGHDLEVRILANLYDVRTKLAREILAELRRKFEPIMFKAFINFNTKLKEGASFGQPITEYDPASMGCRDFVRLAREIIAIGGREETPAAILEQADQLAASAEALLATSVPLLGGKPPSEPAPPASPEQIDKRIEEIYGVRQTPDGVIFRTHAPGAARVTLAGDFNNWDPESTPMQPAGREGDFEARLRLQPGRYRYRLVIDGRWQEDPHNSYVESNPYGELNSVVEVT